MDEKDRIFKKVASVIRDNGKSTYIGEDDMVSLVKGGISINYHIKSPFIDIENVFRTIKRTQKIVKERFDYALDEIVVDIYNSMEEMRQDGRSKSRYASWIAGIYDGRIRIVLEGHAKDADSFIIILIHEIIHHAIAEMSSGKCPYWLDEGLAVYISQNLSDNYLNILTKALKKDKVIPLELLNLQLPAAIPEEMRILVYAETASIVEYIVESCGWAKVQSFIRKCRKKSIEEILAEEGLNYYLLAQAWKRWLRKRLQ